MSDCTHDVIRSFKAANGEFQLFLRVSVCRNGSGPGREHLDAFSGDLFQRRPDRRLLFSFTCENVHLESADGTLTMTGQVLCRKVADHLTFTDLDNLRVRISWKPEVADQPMQVLLDGAWGRLEFQAWPDRWYLRDVQIRAAGMPGLLDDTFPPEAFFGGKKHTLYSVFRPIGLRVRIDRQAAQMTIECRCGTPWTKGELHMAMEHIFTASRRLPVVSGLASKECFALVVDQFDENGDGAWSNNVSGVMFDHIFPAKQGIAVFADHAAHREWPGGPIAPANNRFFTWVHELGHVFDLADHKANASSWMHGMMEGNDFRDWKTFQPAYLPFELATLRHGISHIIIDASDQHAQRKNRLELQLFAQEVFAANEPVELEVRLRNIGTDDHRVPRCLRPEDGRVCYQIRRSATGDWQDYRPFVRVASSDEYVTLTPIRPDDASSSGSDRYSQLVSLAFGYPGPALFQTGTWQVRAIYHGDEYPIFSEPVNVVVEAHCPTPVLSPTAISRLAFFLYEFGNNFYREAEVREYIDYVCTETPKNRIRTRYREGLAGYYGKNLRLFELRPDRTAIDVELVGEDAQTAVRMFDDCLNYYRQPSLNDPRRENFAYRRQAEMHARHLVRSGDPNAASRVVAQMTNDLAERGVKPARLAEIKAGWNLSIT